MAKLPGAFSTKGKEEMGDFSAIPKGDYLARVTKSEMKLTKAAKAANDENLGQMLSLQFEILGPTQKGRNFFRNLNIVNPNQTAVDIAEKELTSICKAVGIAAITDSAELHGKPMMVSLVIKEASDSQKKLGYGDPTNEVRKYSTASASAGASSSEGEEKPKGKKKLF